MPPRTFLSRLLLVSGVLAAAALPTLATPRVDYLVPNHGPTEGGTTVVVVGDGFEPGATLDIGGVAATDVTVIDGRHMVAVTGDSSAAAAGPGPQLGEVVVTNADTSSDSLRLGFSYISTIYYVNWDTGDNANAGTDPAAPKKTVQAALNVYENATPADPPIEIRVAAGRWNSNHVLYYNQVVTGGWSADFTVRDPDTYISILDGSRRNYVARSFGLGVAPTLDGFTLIEGERVAYTGGFYSTDDAVTLSNNVIVGCRTGGLGGAFYQWFQDEAERTVIRSNVFVANRAGDAGGALAFSTYEESLYPHPFTAAPVVDDNLLVGNSAGRGGAIAQVAYPNDELDLLVRGNRIIGSRTTGTGGALQLDAPAAGLLSAEVENNLVRDSVASDVGGGIHLGGTGNGTILLESNTLDGNQGLFSGTQLFQATSNAMTGTVGSHIVRGGFPLFLGGGITVTYSNVEGGQVGAGNIDQSPMFVLGDLGARYLSQAATGEPGQPADSPSVDSGDPLSAGTSVGYWVDERDLDGDGTLVERRTTRTDGGIDTGVVDQGYHWTPVTTSAAAPPTISRVDPQFFSHNGDEWVVIRGSDFAPESLVRFAGADAAETIYHSPSLLVARPQPLARGPKAIQVRNPGPDGIAGNGDDLVGSRSGQTAADTDPPFWPLGTGVQAADDLAECAATIGLTWDAADDAESLPVTYDIYRTTSNPFSEALFLPNDLSLLVDGVTTPWYVDTSVNKQNAYWYIVQARDSSEDPRRELNYVISTVAGTQPTVVQSDTDAPPDIVIDVTTPDSGATVDFLWEPVYPALKYRAYRSLDASLVVDGVNEIGLVDDPVGESFTDGAPPAEEMIFWTIVAEDGCGNQSSS